MSDAALGFAMICFAAFIVFIATPVANWIAWRNYYRDERERRERGGDES